jgi:hypothetical protein
MAELAHIVTGEPDAPVVVLATVEQSAAVTRLLIDHFEDG